MEAHVESKAGSRAARGYARRTEVARNNSGTLQYGAFRWLTGALQAILIVTVIQAASYMTSFGEMITNAPRSSSPDVELGTYPSHLGLLGSGMFGHLTPSVN